MTFWDNNTRNTQRKKDMNQIIYANSLNKELISLLPVKFPQSSILKKICIKISLQYINYPVTSLSDQDKISLYNIIQLNIKQTSNKY